ncbi:MFS transporter [Aureimonas psammosilenae]|uniref:MFS transporter n=1 Tax=Aureimonas psammosilenae TaxID=2495496 RepID=UPI001AEF18D7|nr:MFS transporter [Aureimonas psammosilenae]
MQIAAPVEGEFALRNGVQDRLDGVPLHDAMETSPSPNKVPLVIAVAFLALAVSFGTRAILGLGMQEWTREFGWSRSEVSVVGSLALVVMAVTVPLAGYAADRWGARPILGIGCLTLAGSLIAVSYMTSYWRFILGYGLLSGAGFGLASLPVIGSLVLRRVKSRQGLATGIATSGTTGGQLLIIPALAAFFPLIGWRAAIFGFAALAAFAALLACVFIGRDPPRIRDVGQEAQGGILTRLKPVVTTRAFHGLFWSFALCGFTSTGIVETHLIPFAQICGFSTGAATGAYGIFALFNLVGMVSAGFIADRSDRRRLLVAIYILRAIAFVIPLFVGADYPLLLAFSFLVGIAFYATFPATIGLSAAHFGKANVGSVVGVLTVGHALGAAAGAWFGGYAYDLFLRYDAMWIGSVVLALCSAMFAMLVSDPRSRPPERFVAAGSDAPETAPRYS